MSMKIVTTYDSSGTRHVQLSVQQKGLTVTVKAGAFREEGIEYILNDDYAYDLPEAKNLTVCGYLVKDTAGNDAHVLVDDAASGYEIDWSTMSQYKRLHQLFYFVASASSVNLDDVEILVFHVLPSIS